MNLTNDYSLLKMDKEGAWSLTHKKEADIISNIIYNIVGFNNIILDGTAGIGGNTISFCNKFKQVIAIEKDTERYNLLSENTNNLNNLTLINSTCLTHLSDKYDVIFLDPPWGGLDYKKYDKISLQLDNYNIKTIIDKVKSYSFKENRLCVLKLPFNYNMMEFCEYNYKVIYIRNYLIVLL